MLEKNEELKINKINFLRWKHKQNTNKRWFIGIKEKLELLNKLQTADDNELETSLSWLLQLDPTWVTLEKIEKFNKLIPIVRDWLPLDWSKIIPAEQVALRNNFNHPKRIKNLFAFLWHLYKVKESFDKQRQKVTTYDLFTQECTVTYQPFLVLHNLKNDILSLNDLKDLRLIDPETKPGDVIADKNFQHIYYAEGVLGSEINPSTNVKIEPGQIRDFTENDIDFELSAHLLWAKRLLNEPNLEMFDRCDFEFLSSISMDLDLSIEMKVFSSPVEVHKGWNKDLVAEKLLAKLSKDEIKIYFPLILSFDPNRFTAENIHDLLEECEFYAKLKVLNLDKIHKAWSIDLVSEKLLNPPSSLTPLSSEAQNLFFPLILSFDPNWFNEKNIQDLNTACIVIDKWISPANLANFNSFERFEKLIKCMVEMDSFNQKISKNKGSRHATYRLLTEKSSETKKPFVDMSVHKDVLKIEDLHLTDDDHLNLFGEAVLNNAEDNLNPKNEVEGIVFESEEKELDKDPIPEVKAENTREITTNDVDLDLSRGLLTIKRMFNDPTLTNFDKLNLEASKFSVEDYEFFGKLKVSDLSDIHAGWNKDFVSNKLLNSLSEQAQNIFFPLILRFEPNWVEENIQNLNTVSTIIEKWISPANLANFNTQERFEKLIKCMLEMHSFDEKISKDQRSRHITYRLLTEKSSETKKPFVDMSLLRDTLTIENLHLTNADNLDLFGKTVPSDAEDDLNFKEEKIVFEDKEKGRKDSIPEVEDENIPEIPEEDSALDFSRRLFEIEEPNLTQTDHLDLSGEVVLEAIESNLSPKEKGKEKQLGKDPMPEVKVENAREITKDDVDLDLSRGLLTIKRMFNDPTLTNFDKLNLEASKFSVEDYEFFGKLKVSDLSDIRVGWNKNSVSNKLLTSLSEQAQNIFFPLILRFEPDWVEENIQNLNTVSTVIEKWISPANLANFNSEERFEKLIKCMLEMHSFDEKISKDQRSRHITYRLLTEKSSETKIPFVDASLLRDTLTIEDLKSVCLINSEYVDITQEGIPNDKFNTIWFKNELKDEFKGENVREVTNDDLDPALSRCLLTIRGIFNDPTLAKFDKLNLQTSKFSVDEYEFYAKLKVSGSKDIPGKWNKDPATLKNLLNKLKSEAQNIFFPLILRFDPDRFTLERIKQLNEIAPTLRKWITGNNLAQFNTIERFEKLIDYVSHLHSLDKTLRDDPEYVGRRKFLTTYRLFTENNHKTNQPFLDINKIGDVFGPESVSDIRLIFPGHTHSGTIPNDALDNIYFKDQVQNVEEDPISKQAISSSMVRSVTEDDVGYGLGTYLLRAKRLLNEKGLKNFDAFEIKSLDKRQPFAINSHYETLNIEFKNFKTKLEEFKRKYLTEVNIDDEVKLSPRFFANQNDVDTYQKLSDAIKAADKSNSLQPLIDAVNDNAKQIGIGNFYRTDLAKHCEQFLELYSSHKLISQPKSKSLWDISQPDEYMLDDIDLSIGLVHLAEEYNKAKQNRPTMPQLTLLPVLPYDLLANSLKQIDARSSQYYLGVYTRNSHHVLYFIYKWPSGKKTVVLIDSMYPCEEKTEALNSSTDFFRQNLPGCDVVKLDITQQFNGSSCGICALENARDVVTSFTQPGRNRFLQLKDGQLLIDPTALTLNADKFIVPQRNLSCSAEATKRWHNIFKETQTAPVIKPALEIANVLGYSTMEVEYNFSSKLANSDVEEFAKKILQKFTNSKEYREFLKQIDEIPVENFDKLISLYKETLLQCFAQFKNRGKHLESEAAKALSGRLSADGISLKNNWSFEQYVQNFITDLIMPGVRPSAFNRIVDHVVGQYKAKFFTTNIFLNDKTFESKDELLGIDKSFNAHFEGNYITLLSKNDPCGVLDNEECQYLVAEKIKSYTEQMFLNENNLEGFAGKPLTYGLLDQCILIWKEHYNDSILSRIPNSVFKEPTFIRKIKKILNHNNTDTYSLVGPKVIASINVVLNQWKKSNPKNNLSDRIMAAIESTSTISNFRKALSERTHLGMKEIHESESIVEVTTLAQLEREINSLQNTDIKIINVSSRVIEVLKYIEQELLKPEVENAFLNQKLKPGIISICTSENHISELNFEEFLDAKKQLKSNDDPKQVLVDLIQSVLKGYTQAKLHGKTQQFLAKFKDVKSVKNQTAAALNWIAKYEELQNIDKVMKYANQEADSYLKFTGKMSNFENRLRFINKHYVGRVCYQNVPNNGTITQKKIKITEDLVKNYLLETLKLKKPNLKHKRKNDLIGLYKNYSSIKDFKNALKLVDPNTPGLKSLTTEGRSLLIEACSEAKFDHVKALIKKGSPLDIVDKYGRTVWSVLTEAKDKSQDEIQNATQRTNSHRILKKLFEKIDPDAQVAKAKELLSSAYHNDHDLIFDELLKHINEDFFDYGFDELDGASLLVHAYENNKVNYARSLVEKIGLNVENYNKQIFLSENKSISYLEIALACDADGAIYHLLKSLKDKGDRKLLPEIFQKTILPYFAKGNQNKDLFEFSVKIAKYLGMNLLDPIYGSETLLTAACKKLTATSKEKKVKQTEEVKKIKLLLGDEVGVDPRIANSESETPIEIAARIGNKEIVMALIKSLKNITSDDEPFNYDPFKKAILAAMDANNWNIVLIMLQSIEGRDIHAFKNSLYGSLNHAGKSKAEEIIQNKKSFNDTYLAQLKEAGLFDYLIEQKFDLLKLAKSAINQKGQQKLAIHLFSLCEQNQDFNVLIQQLLSNAYRDNNAELFGDLLKVVQNTDLLGFNRPLNEQGDRYITLAIKDHRNDFVKILTPPVGTRYQGSSEKPINEKFYKVEFYSAQMRAIYSHEDYFTDTHLELWEKLGLFDYLDQESEVSLDTLIPVLGAAIKSGQKRLTERLFQIFKAHFNPMRSKSPALLRFEEENKDVLDWLKGGKVFEAKIDEFFENKANSKSSASKTQVKDDTEKDPVKIFLQRMSFYQKKHENPSDINKYYSTIEKYSFIDEFKNIRKVNIETAQDISVQDEFAQDEKALILAVKSNNIFATRLFLNKLELKSLSSVVQLIEKNDLLYQAFNKNYKVIFVELLQRVNRFDIGGLNKSHPALQGEGGTFLSHIAYTGEQNNWFAPHLLDKGLLWPDQYLLDYRFNKIYEPFLYYLEHDINDNLSEDQITFLKSQIIPIIKASNFDTKIKLIDDLSEYLATKCKDLVVARNVLLIVRNSIIAAHVNQGNHGHSKLHKVCKDYVKIDKPVTKAKVDPLSLDQRLRDQFVQLIKDENEKELTAATEKDSEKGMTALHYAMINKEGQNFAKSLLASKFIKPCINLTDYDERSPLHYACTNGDIDKVTILIEAAKSHDVNLICDGDRVDGSTPLHLASKVAKDDRLVEKLIDDIPAVKQSIDKTDVYGNTALHYVTASNNLEALKKFVQKGASCAIPNNDGNTALHIACQSGTFEMVHNLLKTPTILTALTTKNLKGFIPLDLLGSNPNPEVAKKIREFMTPIYLLQVKANKLETEKNDTACINKAASIRTLLMGIVKEEFGNEIRVVSGLTVTDENNNLFKPRRTYGFFKASSPEKTDTADCVVKLKNQFSANSNNT